MKANGFEITIEPEKLLKTTDIQYYVWEVKILYRAQDVFNTQSRTVCGQICGRDFREDAEKYIRAIVEALGWKVEG